MKLEYKAKVTVNWALYVVLTSKEWTLKVKLVPPPLDRRASISRPESSISISSFLSPSSVQPRAYAFTPALTNSWQDWKHHIEEKLCPEERRRISARNSTFRLSPPPRSMTFLYRLNRLIAILRDERKSSSDEALTWNRCYTQHNDSEKNQEQPNSSKGRTLGQNLYQPMPCSSFT